MMICIYIYIYIYIYLYIYKIEKLMYSIRKYREIDV